MSRLTDLGIRRAKAKSLVYMLFDGRGLGLRIEPSGAKRWHFRFYWRGKQQRISFGCFPEVDLSLARRNAAKKRVGCWLVVLIHIPWRLLGKLQVLW